MMRSMEFIPNEIIIKVNAEFLDADRFQLFYAYSDDLTYVESRSINYQVKGKKGVQDITFAIPLQEGKTLQGIRLDISSANYNQRPITVNSVQIGNGKTQLTYDDILTHFEMSKFLSFKKGKYKTSLINGKYDPYLVIKKDNEEFRQLSRNENRFTLLETLLYSIFIGIIVWILSQFLMKTRKVSEAGLVNAIFIVMIFAPIILYISGVKDTTKQLENREAQETPEFEFSKSYFRNFESYYNDNFPFRNTLTKRGAALKTDIFKVSPFPQKVKFGKGKFLFSNIHEAHISYTHSNLLTEEELKNSVTKFTNRKAKLNAENKEYYLGYFPNKHKIYPEYLPHSMRNQIKDTIALAEQIRDALSQTSLNFFDPKDELYKHKNDNLLYHKLDTHWNDYGAFVAYNAFFNDYKELGIKPYGISEFNISYMTRSWGDLTKLIGTDTIRGYSETRPLFKFKDQSRSYKTADVKGYPTGTLRTINPTSGSDKKVLFFGDSFSVYVMQFFSLHFNEVIYVRDSYNQELIDKINPDIVIELMVERFIYKHL